MHGNGGQVAMCACIRLARRATSMTLLRLSSFIALAITILLKILCLLSGLSGLANCGSIYQTAFSPFWLVGLYFESLKVVFLFSENLGVLLRPPYDFENDPIPP
jgi:hypothetical protein